VSIAVVIAALVAGAVGALARYGVTRAVNARSGPDKVTRAVLIVNIVGSFVAGIMLFGISSGPTADLHYVLVSGFAGGLTTFSTWSVETMQLAMSGKAGAAVRNVLVNLLLGLLAAGAGVLLSLAVGGVLWALG
jgi:CrcB protein